MRLIVLPCVSARISTWLMRMIVVDHRIEFEVLTRSRGRIRFRSNCTVSSLPSASGRRNWRKEFYGNWKDHDDLLQNHGNQNGTQLQNGSSSATTSVSRGILPVGVVVLVNRLER